MKFLSYLVAFGIATSTALASPVATRPKSTPGSPHGKKEGCPALTELPNDVLEKISTHLAKEDATSAACFSQASQTTHTTAKPVLHAKSIERYVGNTPTFVPAVKRCLEKDDVVCFQIVVKAFEKQNKDTPWRMAQVPALAAERGAMKIYKYLGYNTSHPNWYVWEQRRTHPWYHVMEKWTDGDKELQQLGAPFVQKFENAMMTDPSLKDNWKYISFQIDPSESDEDLESLRQDLQVNLTEKIETYKAHLIHVLRKGVHTIDDAFTSNGGTTSDHPVVYWWYFGQEEPIKSFLQWLFDEGAPLDDVSLVSTLAKMKKHKSNNDTDNTRWDRLYNMTKMAIDYTSGSASNSVISMLQEALWPNKLLLEPLHIYDQEFKVNFMDERVVSALVHRLYTKTSSLFESEEFVKFFVKRGFTLDHVTRLVKTLPEPTREIEKKWLTEFEVRLNRMVQQSIELLKKETNSTETAHIPAASG